MDNPEEVLHCLDEFAKLKPKDIPRELEDYLMYVARTGDPVYQWPEVKCLFREKLLNVITEFYETTPTLDLPPSPNVDPFNYESMKSVLLDRLEAFSNAPFTVQRLCELLTTPRKEYNRPDKFMRAIEKNILVVSTREPGSACRPDSALSEPLPNGVSDLTEATNQTSTEACASEESLTVCSKDTIESHVTPSSVSIDPTPQVLEHSGSNSLDTDVGEVNIDVEVKDDVRKEEMSKSEQLNSGESEGPSIKAVPELEKSELSPVSSDGTVAPGLVSVTSEPRSQGNAIISPVIPPSEPTPALDAVDASILPSSEPTSKEAEEVVEKPIPPEKKDASITQNDRIANSSAVSVSSVAVEENCKTEESLTPSSDLKDEACAETSPKTKEADSEKPSQPDALNDQPNDIHEPESALECQPNTSSVEECKVGHEEAISKESAPAIPSNIGNTKTEEEEEKEKIFVESNNSEACIRATENVSEVLVSDSLEEKAQDDAVAGAISVDETNEEEAMDVDESSDQLAEETNGEAMAVAEEGEPMDDSEPGHGARFT